MSMNETPEPAPNIAPSPTPRRRGRSLISILIVVFAVLAIADAALLLYLNRPSPAPVAVVPTAVATLPQTPASPTALPGWKNYSKAGFTIALPDTWQEVQLDDATLQQQIDNVSKDNPHLSDQLRGIMSSGQNKNFAFYAVDAQTKSLVVSNISVARAAVPQGMTATQAAQEFANALPQMLKGAKVVSTGEPTKIGALPAAEVDYDLPLVNAGGQLVTVRGVQFIVLPGTGNAFVLTVSGDASQAEQWTPLARQIIQSFQAQ